MAIIKNWMYVIKCVMDDFIKSKAMPFMAYALLFIYLLARPFSKVSYRFLLASRRAYPILLADSLIKANIGKIISRRSYLENDNPLLLERFIVLKMPVFHGSALQERGVILIKFTETFQPFLKALDVPLLAEYFYFVLEPSWAGYAIESILCWADERYGPVIVFCPEASDYEFISGLGANLVPSALGASDWVDDRIFFPKKIPKVYDFIYVANYNPIKRIHRLIRAISKIEIPGYKGAIVCSSWGKNRGKILNLVKFYRVGERLEVFEDLSQPEINDVVNRSKVNLLLSYKEGANKSVFEGLFAGTPAIVLRENVGVNKAHINKSTGHLIYDNQLETELSWFFQHWQEFDTASWASANISPRISTAKLNNILWEFSTLAGQHWTQDIKVKINSPELQYYDTSNSTLKGILNEKLVKLFDRRCGKRAGREDLIDFSQLWINH